MVLASSIQAALDNPYGTSKRAAEDAVAAYARRCETRAYLYRLPNVFGKWSRPNYNSVVATFCHNIARGLPITVNDPAAQVPLVYIDDVAAAFVRALEGAAIPDAEGRCAVKPEYRITVGDLAAMLGRFRDMRDHLECPDQSDPLTAKLYATYLSFLPPGGFRPPHGYPCRRAGIVYGAFASGRPWTGQRERLPSAHQPRGSTGITPSMRNSWCSAARA